MPCQAYNPRRRTILVAFALALIFSSAPEQSPAARGPASSTKPSALRTLTSLRAAHSLSANQARRGYPIHVRALVTYYDPNLDSRRIALFLHDSTGGMYAAVPHGTVWPGRTPLPGTLVDVTGVSAPGDFAPILDQPHITVLGQSHVPTRAESATLSELLTGTQDGQWVEIEGVVHSVSETANNVTLRIAMDGGIIGATTVRQQGVDYQHLVDDWVHLRGNAAPMFNSNSQLTGVRLFFSGLETVTAEAPGALDAFSLPVQPINSLMRFSSAVAWPHRIHVRGAVTMYWPGRTLCIYDGTEALCAQTSQTTPLKSGTLVDLVGFTVLDGFNPGLSDASFKRWADSPPVYATSITPVQALEGSRDSTLVRIDGQLIGRDLESADTILILSSGKSIFRAILPATLSSPDLAKIPVGSTLQVTGICSAQIDPYGTLEGYGATQASRFWILLRSAPDVVTLRTPSWWTAGRVSLALFASMIITVAGFVWVFVLRRRVEQQTRELRQSRERYRHMAHHDELSGLPMRTLFQDHLQTALDRAQRFHQSIALLMLDLDKFKQINDSYGHATGDRVLRVTAGRLRAAIRKTDSLARMGGDEFIVLLNDLQDASQAERIAEKIVASLSEPVSAGKLLLPVSVSVGVCTLSDELVDADLLLKRVDAAMYRAKENGRCCFQVFTADMLTTPSHSPDPAAMASSSQPAVPTSRIQ